MHLCNFSQQYLPLLLHIAVNSPAQGTGTGDNCHLYKLYSYSVAKIFSTFQASRTQPYYSSLGIVWSHDITPKELYGPILSRHTGKQGAPCAMRCCIASREEYLHNTYPYKTNIWRHMEYLWLCTTEAQGCRVPPYRLCEHGSAMCMKPSLEVTL